MTTRFLARPTRGSLRARSRSSSGAAGVETPKSGRKRRKDPIPDPYLPPPPPSSFPDWEPRDFFRFELVHQSRKPGSRARVGRIHTPHGVIDTPSYVPVATQGALKFVDHRALEGMAPHLMFANTYHLVLNPGPDTVAAAGGLHKFMNRDQPLITDSGGFQIFSLALESGKGEAHPIELKGSVRKREGHEPTLLSVSEEGVVFKSYRDGTLLSLTPESTVDAQKAFGADIIIPLDELPPYHLDRDALIRSVMLTHRWEARSLRRHLADVRQQAMYGVVHGGVDLELRLGSAEYLTALPFDGYAIGGALGRDRSELIWLLEHLMPRLPDHKPNHLLGIADAESIHRAVPLGVDTFDSVFPTRNARHASVLYRLPATPPSDAPQPANSPVVVVVPGKCGGGGEGVSEEAVFEHGIGKLNLRKTEHARSFDQPIDPACGCPTCRNHSRAYLHHLVRAEEPVAAALLTTHNLHFMSDMMAQVRAKILADEL